MTRVAELMLRRPARADARRNFDALVEAARAAFAEAGTDVPLEEIARQAGVGIGTLYRNFPTREALIEMVYLREVEAVCLAAEDVADLEPWTALKAWLRRFISYVGTKKALISALNRNSGTLLACRDSLYEAGAPLLARAQAAGLVRSDTSIDDLMRLITGIAAANFVDEEQRDRVMDMALDGFRLRSE